MTGTRAERLDPAAAVTIGEVTRPHGVAGMLRVKPLTDFPQRFQGMDSVWMIKPGQPGSWYAVEEAKLHQQWVLLKLSGLDDRDTAEQWRGALLQVSEQEVVDLPAGHYYVYELQGFSVVNTAGDLIGSLFDVLSGGPHDLLVIERPDGQRALVPAVHEFVCEIDPRGRRIVIDPVPGLIE